MLWNFYDTSVSNQLICHFMCTHYKLIFQRRSIIYEWIYNFQLGQMNNVPDGSPKNCGADPKSLENIRKPCIKS